MFTGIISGLGLVAGVSQTRDERRFLIKALYDSPAWETGESISINGVCLSVERHDGRDFQVYASEETLRASTLGALRQGDKVNLEPALTMSGKLGGHFVSGHVDCVAIVAAITMKGESREIRVSFPSEFGAEVVAKGSVALDGISLTINLCGLDFLTVNIIPDSLERTNIRNWRVGSRLNMETDIIGKYVQKALLAGNFLDTRQSGLTWEFLGENGFLR